MKFESKIVPGFSIIVGRDSLRRNNDSGGYIVSAQHEITPEGYNLLQGRNTLLTDVLGVIVPEFNRAVCSKCPEHIIMAHGDRSLCDGMEVRLGGHVNAIIKGSDQLVNFRGMCLEE